jgi:glutathione S-transferase
MWTLEEIGEPYEVTIVSREDRASEEYRERHPLGRVRVVEKRSACASSRS